ncbi:hypothetical protein DH2020_048723 [Rehmannia glutinosa]|uniref:Uncharacterized protein n=1 Tax=Rehmannia glutinosa TaxID=99300 RepID=A0ABR0U4Z2_REHGL
MDEERRKRTRRTTLDQLEEERIFPVIESENDEVGDTDTTSASDSDEDFEYSDEEFFYGGIQSELDLSEDEYDEYDFDQEMEEDDVDPDELSFEELRALGEMVGVENTGISEAEISKHLHPFTCHSTTNLLIDRFARYATMMSHVQKFPIPIAL